MKKALREIRFQRKEHQSFMIFNYYSLLQNRFRNEKLETAKKEESRNAWKKRQR